MWAKKGRKRKKYAINFDFLDVINFIFTCVVRVVILPTLLAICCTISALLQD